MAPQLQADLARRYGGEYCNTRRAADLLGVSASFLNKKRLTGDGPAFNKFGRTVRYRVDGLLEWAACKRRSSTSDAGKSA
jgi:hypothetical protein